jgi:transcription elongation factor Elf1
MKLSEISIHAWLQEHNIKNEKGEPLDFKNHLFLFDIYRDQSPKLVCLKAAQIGFSTMAIIKSLYIAKMNGMDIIYTMPTSSDMKDFVGGKVNRIIAQNPVLLDYVKDKDSIEQKQVGDNIVYYRGTFTEKAAIAVSSDLNIHDEEDRSNQDVIQQYSSRLQHSKHKYSWHFSNPSVEGNGVSRYWTSSDQKHWFIKCSGCTKEQYLSWPDSISKTKRSFVCKHCGVELSQQDRRVGRWVAKFSACKICGGSKEYKGHSSVVNYTDGLDAFGKKWHKYEAPREYSGYWISLLMAPWITASEIINYYETKSKEYFWNFVLGLPYVGEGNTVTPDVIYRNVSSRINSQERVVIGCDSGLIKHFVCGNREGIFYYGKTETWDDIASLLKKFDRSICVIDHLPDLTGPRKLQEQFPGRVFLCHYVRDRTGAQYVTWGTNKDSGTVKVDRNRMIQSNIDEFAERHIALQGTADDWGDYIKHWMTLYKVTDVNSLGSPEFRWETSTGEDHWVHATSYWRAGMTRFGNGGGELFGVEKKINVPVGPELKPDHTMTAINPKKLFRFEEPESNYDWRETNG